MVQCTCEREDTKQLGAMFMSELENGCINIWIDGIVPCLRDTETGEMKETVVFRIESRK